MKEINILDYVIVSNNCNGYQLYAEFIPNVHPAFIDYPTPLIAHNIRDDFQFLKLCENYDHYMSLKCSEVKEQDTSEWFNLFLDDINILIRKIHPGPGNFKFESWKGRAAKGIGKTKIFIWDIGWLYRAQSIKEREKIIERFRKLDGYSFFLTNRKEEEFEDAKHLVKYYPEFDLCRRDETLITRNEGLFSRNNHLTNICHVPIRRTIPYFRKIIEEKLN